VAIPQECTTAMKPTALHQRIKNGNIETYQASPTHEYTDSTGNTDETNEYIQDGIIYETHQE